MPKRGLFVALVWVGVFIAPLPVLSQEDSGALGPDIRFMATLSADEETAPTESPGSGCAVMVLVRETLEFSWKVTYSRLTSSAIGAHVHGPQNPGMNAGVLFDLASDGVKSPVNGSVILNEGQLKYILNRRTYVNIHTTNFPAGELRGQIIRIRPEQEKVTC